jgi:RNA polymerase sigma-70 factor (ECF subfamily)
VFREPRFIERFRAGDEEALATVYSAYVDDVTRIASAVLRACSTGSARGHSEIAAALPDVVQEVFIKAFAPEARSRFDAERPFEPYLAQIARNVAVDHWRQMRRYVPASLDQMIDRLSFENAAGAAAGDWSDAETMAVVNRYIASLDEESRRIHEALYVNGMSQRDAAEALGVGRQVIRTCEARLRQGLQRELARVDAGELLPLRRAATKGTG